MEVSKRKFIIIITIAIIVALLPIILIMQEVLHYQFLVKDSEKKISQINADELETKLIEELEKTELNIDNSLYNITFAVCDSDNNNKDIVYLNLLYELSQNTNPYDGYILACITEKGKDIPEHIYIPYFKIESDNNGKVKNITYFYDAYYGIDDNGNTAKILDNILKKEYGMKSSSIDSVRYFRDRYENFPFGETHRNYTKDMDIYMTDEDFGASFFSTICKNAGYNINEIKVKNDLSQGELKMKMASWKLSTENNVEKQIGNNTTQEDDEVNNKNSAETLAVEFNKKYKLKEVGVVDSYIIFENNHFEICYEADGITTYQQGDYLQNKEQIQFKVFKEGYKFENEMTGVSVETEQIGNLSNGGKTITILAENPDDTLVYEVSEETATMQEISVQEINTQQTETSNQKPNNTNTSNKNNTSVNNSNQKEMVQVPYFDNGNKLEYYTKELDKLGIKYKVVKAQDLEYKDNTVIKVEHNGEYVEKGSTITITVADNTYKVNVYINTEFLVSKAGLGDKSLKEVSIILKINGQTVYNGKAPVSSDFYNRTYGQYKGKIDNFDIEVTVEGKKIKLEKLDYNYTDYYDNTPQIVINNFSGMG